MRAIDDVTVLPAADPERTSPSRLTGAAGLTAAVCLVVQAAHVFEHLLQFGYWVIHPSQPPWMTPWAMWLHRPLMVDGSMALGVELLHLFGNTVFFAGLVALAVWYAAYGYRIRDCRPLGIALAVQGVHLVEHVVLTITAAWAGTSVGVSTLFGLVDGPVMTSWRVWFHFGINAVATWYALEAVRQARHDVGRWPAPGGVTG